MTNTQFALVQWGYPVFGTGPTPEAAIEDGRQWLDTPREEPWDAFRDSIWICPDAPRNMQDGAFMVLPCSPALAAYVSANGGALVYTLHHTGALVLETELQGNK